MLLNSLHTYILKNKNHKNHKKPQKPQKSKILNLSLESAEEFSGEDHVILIEYEMIDFAGVSRLKGQEIVILLAKNF